MISFCFLSDLSVFLMAIIGGVEDFESGKDCFDVESAACAKDREAKIIVPKNRFLKNIHTPEKLSIYNIGKKK